MNKYTELKELTYWIWPLSIEEREYMINSYIVPRKVKVKDLLDNDLRDDTQI